MTTLPDRFETAIVGVKFIPQYPKQIKAVIAELDETPDGYVGGVELELVREPENEHDPNCVAVHFAGQKIGCIPALLAERLAPELDVGVGWSVSCNDVWLGEHPGLRAQLERET